MQADESGTPECAGLGLRPAAARLPARVPARPTEHHVHAGLGAVVPHVGDHRTVEVRGTDFFAAHRLEKGPAVGGRRERAGGPGSLERGRRGAQRGAGRAAPGRPGTRAGGGGRGCARRRRERRRLPPPRNPYLVASTFFSNGQN